VGNILNTKGEWELYFLNSKPYSGKGNDKRYIKDNDDKMHLFGL